MAFAVDGDLAYVSNRFQVAAFDLKNGKRLWQTAVGGEHAKTHDWTLTPMKPLIVGDRIFVRRLVKVGPDAIPELVASTVATGTSSGGRVRGCSSFPTPCGSTTVS